MITREQLEKFCRIRNESDFTSNLQFQIDAEECGFSISDLGKVEKIIDGHYAWNTPAGRLVEKGGHCTIE